MQYMKPPQILSLGGSHEPFRRRRKFSGYDLRFRRGSAAFRRPAWRKNGVSPEGLAQGSHGLYDLDPGLHVKEQDEPLIERDRK